MMPFIPSFCLTSMTDLYPMSSSAVESIWILLMLLQLLGAKSRNLEFNSSCTDFRPSNTYPLPKTTTTSLATPTWLHKFYLPISVENILSFSLPWGTINAAQFAFEISF